jgi:hypothetical protein
MHHSFVDMSKVLLANVAANKYYYYPDKHQICVKTPTFFNHYPYTTDVTYGII